MEGELIIGLMSVILTVGVVPLSLMYFLHRVKAKKLDTMVKVVELSGTVDPEMMKLLSNSTARETNYKTDYKYGLIWLAIGLPLCLGIFLESGISEAIFGSIPVLIGLAYVISGKYRLREAD
ncbi:MAG: DUF6249 domain-containing protein [Pseudohongiellaceae bacterium]